VRARSFLAAVASAALLGTVVGSVPGALAGSPCDAPLACGEDLDEAMRLEQRVVDHFWYGSVLPIEYRTPEKVLGEVASIDPQWGDAGIWSGSYLGAQAYRYAVARAHEARGEQRGFWREQRRQAKERVDLLLSQVDLRTYVARAWQEPVQPAVTPGAPPAVEVGGVVPGQPGMLMYSCAPADAPPALGMPRGSDVRGPFRWDGNGRPARLTQPPGDYVCEASTTRDAYAGTLFGLLAAFDLVAADDPEVQDLIRDDVLAMADFLLAHGWSYPHPHGEVSTGDVHDNVVTPLMVISPAYRLLLSLAAKHVAEVAGPAEQALKWQAVWAEELASQSPSDVVAELVNDPTPNAGYFSWNLVHLVFSPLLRLTTPAERALLRESFSIVDRQTADDVNAFFETVTFGMGGEPSRRDAAVTHLRQWRDYRARQDAGGGVDHTVECGVSRECVPADEFDLVWDTPAGEQRTTVPGSSSDLRSVEPIPVADRVPTDFLWQRSPFTAMRGGFPATHQEPGVDYLLPYWMLRYLTEVAPPAHEPLPVWPGPRYSGS